MVVSRIVGHSFFGRILLPAVLVAAVGCSTDSGPSSSATGGNAGSGPSGSSGSSGTSAGGGAAGSAPGGSGPDDSTGGAVPSAGTGGYGGGAVRAGAGGSDGGGDGGEAGASAGATFWKPLAGASWQWQLSGKIDQSIDASVYDIDGFDADASLVEALHARGRKVICYLSVGSFEDWRPDAKSFPASVLGNEYPGWPGERFVDIRAKALRDIMASRFDLCRQKGFDGIEPDNMDVFAAKSGFPLTQKDGLDYANWLASEAHARGMNIGQKNAPEIAKALEPNFDWVLTEDCFDQGWCADVAVYVERGKPVFMNEYTDTGVDFGAACSWAKPKKYSPILKGRDLDAAVQFCP